MFFHYFKWNWGGLGVSRVTARTVRRHRRNFSRDLVLHDIRKSTFSEILEFQCTRNGPQILPFCPGSLQDTFIIYSSISHQHIFSKILPNQKQRKFEIWKSENLTLELIVVGSVSESRLNPYCIVFEVLGNIHRIENSNCS